MTEVKEKQLPPFNVGDTVKVYVRISEGEKTRSQVFEGKVIRLKGRGANKTFTVRKLSYGEGVERIFPLRSPVVEKIEVVKSQPARRAKLYYLRKKAQ